MHVVLLETPLEGMFKQFACVSVSTDVPASTGFKTELNWKRFITRPFATAPNSKSFSAVIGNMFACAGPALLRFHARLARPYTRCTKWRFAPSPLIPRNMTQVHIIYTILAHFRRTTTPERTPTLPPPPSPLLLKASPCRDLDVLIELKALVFESAHDPDPTRERSRGSGEFDQCGPPAPHTHHLHHLPRR